MPPHDCQPSCPPECLLHDLDGLDGAQAQGFRRAYYPAQRVLFEQNDLCHGRVFLLCTGLIGRWWGQGKSDKCCLEVLGPGDWLGPECWSDELWICEGRALTEVSGWWVREAQWFELVHRWEIHERFLQRQRERLRHLHEWQVVLAYGSVRGRVAWWLLRLGEWVGVDETRTNPQDKGKGIFVPLHLTQEQQAELVGASRPVVSQVLKRFQERGWLVCGREGYWIRDRDALAEQSREIW